MISVHVHRNIHNSKIMQFSNFILAALSKHVHNQNCKKHRIYLLDSVGVLNNQHRRR
jgi:hypothetical protein